MKRSTLLLVLLYLLPAITQAETGLNYKYWQDRIALSGILNVTGFAANHTPTTIGIIPSNIGSSPASSDLSVTLASVTANAKLADWLNALITTSYQQTSPAFIRSPDGGGDTLFVDQAFLTFADTHKTPFYLIAGRRWVDFGGLDDSSYLESTTQLLTLMRQTLASLGIDWKGWNSSIYAFRGLNAAAQPNSNKVNNYGINIEYLKKDNQFGYGIGAGYISNLVSALYPGSTVANSSSLNGGNYHTAVSALYLHAIFNWHNFDASVKYANALNAFSVLDIPFTTNSGLSFRGAKPATWGFNAGYHFNIMHYSTRFGLGYQGSAQSVALGKASGSATQSVAGVYGTAFAIGMPRSRYYANYTIRLIKWADIGIEIAKDQGYIKSNGGTGRSTLTGLLTVLTHIS